MIQHRSWSSPSLRQLEAILQSVPDLVSPEEELIDFVTSIAQEEEEEELEMDIAVAADASSNPDLDALAPLVAEVEQRDSRGLSGPKTIQPKRLTGGPGSTPSSDSKSARARRTSTTNMELEQDLADELAASDLQGFTPLLVKLRMISLRYVKRYSVKQLESAMCKVGGNTFAFTSIDRKLWTEFGHFCFVGCCLFYTDVRLLPMPEPDLGQRRPCERPCFCRVCRVHLGSTELGVSMPRITRRG